METTRMQRIDRKDLRAPALVLDVELATASKGGGEVVAVERYCTIWCLSRVDGVPRDISFWDVTDDAIIPIRALCDRFCTGTATDEPVIEEPPLRETASPGLTVVICTRDRPAGLRAALFSLQHQTDSEFRVVVVDNGSSSPESAEVVKELDLPHCDYVVEPRPGLSRARNQGLKAVATELVAWIDDDEIADTDWVHRLKQGFAHEANPVAVCGVMLPMELEFEAQVRFEQYGGFNKGRGMAPEVLRKGTPSVVSPLYPLPPFGPGGNMAFRTESLISVGGFDPCLGAGTRTHGCEETRVLSMLLSAGDTVLHWPAAITWHTHRREMTALRKQFYGYSAGTSAFYASMILSRPSAAFEILRLIPSVFRDFRNGSENLRSGHLPEDFPSDLLRAARRGLLEGAFMYFYEAVMDRLQSVSTVKEDALTIETPLTRKDAVNDAGHS
jgi:glycosyltransferase involved in cell wall biosynthesis